MAKTTTPTKSSPSSSTSNSATSSSVDFGSVLDEIFEEICDEVIKCDDRAPSVPDVILQVISEILSESSQQAPTLPQTTATANDNEISTNDINDHDVSANNLTSNLSNGVASVTSSPPPLINDQASANVSASSIARVISNYHASSNNHDTDKDGKFFVIVVKT